MVGIVGPSDMPLGADGSMVVIVAVEVASNVGILKGVLPVVASVMIELSTDGFMPEGIFVDSLSMFWDGIVGPV